MVSVLKEAKRIGQSAQALGDAVADSVLDFGKSRTNAANAMAERMLKRSDARAIAADALKEAEAIRSAVLPAEKSGFFMSIIKPVARFSVWLVELPVTIFLLKPVKWALNLGTVAFTKFPRATPVLAIAAGAAGIASWMDKQNGARMQAQNEALQQMQAAQTQPAVSYMNSASQADVDARIAADRENGVAGQGASKADALMAARTQVPAPGTADSVPPL